MKKRKTKRSPTVSREKLLATIDKRIQKLWKSFEWEIQSEQDQRDSDCAYGAFLSLRRLRQYICRNL